MSHHLRSINLIPSVLSTLTFISVSLAGQEPTASTFPYPFEITPKKFSKTVLDKKPYDRLSVALQYEPLFAYLYAGPYEDQLDQNKKHFKANPLTGETALKVRLNFLKKHKVNSQINKKGKLEYKHVVMGFERPSQSASQTSIYWKPELLETLKQTSAGLKNVELYLNFVGLHALINQGASAAFPKDLAAIQLPPTGSDFLNLFNFTADDFNLLIKFARNNETLWQDTLFKRVYNLDPEELSSLLEQAQTPTASASL